MHCAVLRDLACPTKPAVWDARSELAKELDAGWLLSDLEEAEALYGHNILGFDLPALKKLYGFEYSGTVMDTSVLACLAYPNEHLKHLDFERKGFPKHLAGHQTLEAWGHRLGCHKGEFKGPWETCTQEMVDYCVQDTEVNLKLLEHLRTLKLSKQSVELEHAFADYLEEQRRRGVYFNIAKATALAAELKGKIEAVDRQLMPMIEMEWMEQDGENVCLRQSPMPSKPGPHWLEPYILPSTGEERIRFTKFNPGSDPQLARYFVLKYGWAPKDFTDKGRPSLVEKVLSALDFPEIKLLVERKVLDKRYGTIAKGPGSLLRHVTPSGRIHQRVKHNGAVTSRCTHSSPNFNLPRNTTAYGLRFRELFEPTPGMVLVGADASGLELRCLAHRIEPFDGGQYVETVTTGDVHAANQKAAGLKTRDQAKTFIYAFLYGAGDAKIGSIVGGGAQAGGKLRKRFLARTRGLQQLLDQLEPQVRRGYLIGMDGRRIPVRHRHAVLNTRLQSDGAVYMKQATVLFRRFMEEAGFPVGEGWWPVIHQHDEIQAECLPDLVDTLKAGMVKAFEKAGKVLKFRCPMTGEAIEGKSWADTH